MKHISFIFLIITFALIFGVSGIVACVCRPPSEKLTTPEQELNFYRNKAKTVLLGKVINETTLSRKISQNKVATTGTLIKIRVIQFWGQPVPKEIILIGGFASCNARFSLK